ncbi:MAG: hypothetical protein IJL87_02335, partial [Clostridia bacterium]|nr:hypothetical protein [Clostridia bacterium]
MDKISAWSASVMCACVICAAVKFLIPEAQKKIIGFVLGLFMLSVIIEPFGQLVSAVKNFEISDITGDIQTSENVDI